MFSHRTFISTRFRPLRSLSTTRSRRVPHSTDSYVKDVDSSPAADSKVHRVDPSSENVQKPYEPPSNSWSEAGVKTNEYRSDAKKDETNEEQKQKKNWFVSKTQLNIGFTNEQKKMYYHNVKCVQCQASSSLTLSLRTGVFFGEVLAVLEALVSSESITLRA